MRNLTPIAIILLLSAFAAGGLRWYGHARWQASTRDLRRRLEAARESPEPARHDARELDGLPPVVQRYFRAALRDGAPIVAAAEVRHVGSFNSSETGERWLRFESVQRVVTRRPGFVWDARISMLPGVAVHVHDAYIAGEGLLQAAVAGLVPLASQRGTGGFARDELMRFFAEAAWLPTVLLPSQGVAWTALDDRSASATLDEGGHRIQLTFGFGDDGLIETVRADARGRRVGGTIVPTPWEGRWTRYETRDGMRVPVEGEVAWLLREGRKPYWRGTVTSLRCEFAA